MQRRADEVDALVPKWERVLEPSMVARLELGKRVARIGGLFEQAVRAELAELGLTYAEFDVLAALARVDPPHRMKPSELSKSLFLTSGGTSNVLHRLETAGYVRRGENPGDARSRWVELTAEGFEITKAALEASNRAHTEVMAGVPDKAIREAADALREILVVVGRRRVR